MSNILHRKRVDQIIELFEAHAQPHQMNSDIPHLYEFRGTDNQYIRFTPDTRDGSMWYMLIWTANRYAHVKDARDWIHALLSNGYHRLFKDYYRSNKKYKQFKLVYTGERMRVQNEEASREIRDLIPLCHILAMYKRNRYGHIYFLPMYQHVVNDLYESGPSEEEKQ